MPTRHIGPEGFREEDVDAASPISDYIQLASKPVSEDDLVRQVWGRIEASHNDSLDERYKEWPLNYQFVLESNQWTWWNEVLEEMLPMPVEAAVQLTENQMIGLAAHIAAGLVQSPPAFDVVPLNQDWAARASARASKMLLAAYARDLDLTRISHRSALDSILFGVGVEKTYWNPAAGPVDFEYAPRRQQKIDEDAAKREEKAAKDGEAAPVYEQDLIKPDDLLGAKESWYSAKPRHKGEICIENVLPWALYPQVGLEEPSFRRAEYVCELKWMSEAAVRRLWKIPADVEIDHTVAAGYHTILPGGRLPTSDHEGVTRDGRVLVACYYQKPAPVPGWERGAQIYVCGKKLLGINPLQSKGGKLPFHLYPWLPRRGKFWPRPPASDWREPQTRINMSASHLTTWEKILCGPNLVVQRGSGVPEDVEIGFKRLEYAMGSNPPAWLPPPPAPPELFNMKAQAETGLERVAMTFRAGFGQHQKNIPAAQYVAMLLERDAVDQMPIVRDHAASRQEQGELLLDLAKQFEDEERMVAISGENGKGFMFNFKREQIQTEKYRVWVQPGSMMQYLSGARLQQFTELLERGAFGAPGQLDPRARRAIFRWMNLPNLTEIEDEWATERRLSERNHDQIVWEMQEVQIDERWDPAPLLEEATLRLMEDDVPHWPGRVKELFDAYFNGLQQGLQKRQEMAAQAQQEAAMQQVALQGAVAEGEAQAKAKGEIAVDAANKMLDRAQKSDKPPGAEETPEDESGEQVEQDTGREAGERMR